MSTYTDNVTHVGDTSLQRDKMICSKKLCVRQFNSSSVTKSRQKYISSYDLAIKNKATELLE